MGNEQSSSSKNPIAKGISSLKSGPSHGRVQSHLENAKKSRILQLKGCGIKHIPDGVDEIAELLRNLDLANNKIVEIPVKISRFTALKQVNFSNNKLSVLPDEIGCLKNLESLDVSYNNIETLPESLSALRALKTLNVSNNKIGAFPTVVVMLFNVEMVDLSNNLISNIPDNIKDLKATELNLNRNRLSSLNDNLALCPNLKVFRVDENCLEKRAFTEKILKESTLSLITYNGNLFQDSDFQHLPGYEQYQDRFTATKRKGM